MLLTRKQVSLALQRILTKVDKMEAVTGEAYITVEVEKVIAALEESMEEGRK